MTDVVRLRPQRPASDERGVLGLAALFLGVALVLLARPWWNPTPPPGLPVEVRGDVPRPGLYLVDPPTLAAAVEAAGGLATGVPETRLHPGDAVQVGFDGVRVVPSGDPLLVALPVDVNVNGLEALAAVPGLGGREAQAIVADREAHGPFADLDDLRRVPGIGAGTLDRVRGFLTVGDAPLRVPLDVNRASAEALRALPGVGEVLADRIVLSREQAGPFRDLDDLTRVSGVGPALVERLRGRAEAAP